MSEDEDDEAVEETQEGPHRGIRLLGIVVAASVIGATLGAFIAPDTSLGEIMIAIPLIMLALAGAFGIMKNEPIVSALAGLGFLLVLEPLAEVAIILLAGAFGFLLAATLAVLETYLKNSRD